MHGYGYSWHNLCFPNHYKSVIEGLFAYPLGGANMRDERCCADTLPIQPCIGYCIGCKDLVLKSIAMNVKDGGKVSLCSVFRCVIVSPGFLTTNGRDATAGCSIVYDAINAGDGEGYLFIAINEIVN